MKVVADRDIPFLEGVLEPFAEVVYLRGEGIGTADVRDADVLLTRTRTRCDAALLAGSRVRFIGTATIGYDHIDMEWCAAQGITVATAAGCNARGVLQWVAAALAFLSTYAPSGFSCRRGLIPPETILGVAGVGHVGSIVAKYAAAWGFCVMCSDPPRERAEGLGSAEGFYPLHEIVSQADIITFHVPLVADGPDATRHMVGREFMAATKPGAVILNSSRGAVIDPAALREAVGLKPAKGKGAACCPSVLAVGNELKEISFAPPAKAGRFFMIDTWNGEPDIDREVLGRVLLGTPHIAGYSAQGKAKGTSLIINALAREFGLPLTDWFPPGGRRSEPREISWEEMCATMSPHFDIAAESAALKAAPELFEAMRSNYNYRMEYF